jgi:uncharacterized protein
MGLSLTTALVIGLFGVLLGVALGCTSVGGVLLVPFLTYGVGMPVHAAIPAALFSYLWSGLLAVALYARRGSIPWGMAGWLTAAALPGAYLGTRAAAFVSGTVLQALIAAVLVTAGLHACARPHPPDAARQPFGGGALLLLGGLTGLVSALVGAGGAFLLVPLLVALGQPVLPALGLGQLIQVPISAVASLAAWHAGRLDVRVGALLAVALSLGIAVGTPLAHALPQPTLRRLLGIAMLVAGLAVAVRLAVG